MGIHFGGAKKRFPGWKCVWAEPSEAFPDGKRFLGSVFLVSQMGKGKRRARKRFPEWETTFPEPGNTFPSGKQIFGRPKTQIQMETELGDEKSGQEKEFSKLSLKYLRRHPFFERLNCLFLTMSQTARLAGHYLTKEQL